MSRLAYSASFFEFPESPFPDKQVPFRQMIVVGLVLCVSLLDHFRFDEHKASRPWARSRNEKNLAGTSPEDDLVQLLKCNHVQKHANFDACPHSSHRRHRHYIVIPSYEVDLISIFVAQKQKQEEPLMAADAYCHTSPCQRHCSNTPRRGLSGLYASQKLPAFGPGFYFCQPLLDLPFP